MKIRGKIFCWLVVGSFSIPAAFAQYPYGQPNVAGANGNPGVIYQPNYPQQGGAPAGYPQGQGPLVYPQGGGAPYNPGGQAAFPNGMSADAYYRAQMQSNMQQGQQMQQPVPTGDAGTGDGGGVANNVGEVMKVLTPENIKGFAELFKKKKDGEEEPGDDAAGNPEVSNSEKDPANKDKSKNAVVQEKQEKKEGGTPTAGVAENKQEKKDGTPAAGGTTTAQGQSAQPQDGKQVTEKKLGNAINKKEAIDRQNGKTRVVGTRVETGQENGPLKIEENREETTKTRRGQQLSKISEVQETNAEGKTLSKSNVRIEGNRKGTFGGRTQNSASYQTEVDGDGNRRRSTNEYIQKTHKDGRAGKMVLRNSQTTTTADGEMKDGKFSTSKGRGLYQVDDKGMASGRLLDGKTVVRDNNGRVIGSEKVKTDKDGMVTRYTKDGKGKWVKSDKREQLSKADLEKYQRQKMGDKKYEKMKTRESNRKVASDKKAEGGAPKQKKKDGVRKPASEKSVKTQKTKKDATAKNKPPKTKKTKIPKTKTPKTKKTKTPKVKTPKVKTTRTSSKRK